VVVSPPQQGAKPNRDKALDRDRKAWQSPCRETLPSLPQADRRKTKQLCGLRHSNLRLETAEVLL
jgi:hypothetical protein